MMVAAVIETAVDCSRVVEAKRNLAHQQILFTEQETTYYLFFQHKMNEKIRELKADLIGFK